MPAAWATRMVVKRSALLTPENATKQEERARAFRLSVCSNLFLGLTWAFAVRVQFRSPLPSIGSGGREL
jgi:hypothetical protein